MNYKANDKFENLVTGEHVIIVNGYSDINPNNETVYCYNLETMPNYKEQKINKYHITEHTLELYYRKTEE